MKKLIAKNVIHPSHYRHGSIEPIDVIEDWNLDFNLGSVIKYVGRAGHKDDYLQAQMKKIVNIASETYVKSIGSFIRAAQFNDKAKLFQIFDYYFFYTLINDTKMFQNILSDYPSISLKAVQSYLIKDKAKLEKVMQAEEEYRKVIESHKTTRD